MKKILGILFSIQLALITLFLVSVPASAQWDGGTQRGYYQQNVMYRNHGNYDHPSFFDHSMPMNNNLLTYISFYKVGVDIILSILFILFFSQFIMKSFAQMSASPFKNGYVGFTFLIIFPIISLILLGLLWLGIASFLLYGLIFLVAIFLTKIFVGWLILQKVEKGYVLDWKAGVVGPLVVYILLFIPVLGWITLAVILSIAAGSLLHEVKPFIVRQKAAKKSKN